MKKKVGNSFHRLVEGIKYHGGGNLPRLQKYPQLKPYLILSHASRHIHNNPQPPIFSFLHFFTRQEGYLHLIGWVGNSFWAKVGLGCHDPDPPSTRIHSPAIKSLSFHCFFPISIAPHAQPISPICFLSSFLRSSRSSRRRLSRSRRHHSSDSTSPSGAHLHHLPAPEDPPEASIEPVKLRLPCLTSVATLSRRLRLSRRLLHSVEQTAALLDLRRHLEPSHPPEPSPPPLGRTNSTFCCPDSNSFSNILPTKHLYHRLRPPKTDDIKDEWLEKSPRACPWQPRVYQLSTESLSMSLARVYGRSSWLSSLCKTLNRTPVDSRSLLQIEQRRYSFVGATTFKHTQFYSQVRHLTSESSITRNPANKIPNLGIGYLKTPLGSHRHYVTNVIQEQKSRKMLYYLTGLVFAMVGCTYAAVPLYRRFCQATGYGGTVQRRETVEEKIARHAQDGTVTNREIVVQFNADVSDGMPWKFIPTQREVRVKPGESALAFYTAENRSSTPITGMSTYNVTPMKAAVYFNKIQCFCFEEQRLLPGEQIDMPVFFYIDPEFETDPRMDGINNIILSYTFFKIGEDKL